MYTFMADVNRDEKPSFNLSDLFFSAIRKKYVIRLYNIDENSMSFELIVDADKSFMLGIHDMKQFNQLLFFYVNYLNNLKMKSNDVDYSMDDIFQNMINGLTQKDAFDFNQYLEKQINILEGKVRDNKTK